MEFALFASGLAIGTGIGWLFLHSSMKETKAQNDRADENFRACLKLRERLAEREELIMREAVKLEAARNALERLAQNDLQAIALDALAKVAGVPGRSRSPVRDWIAINANAPKRAQK